MVLSRELMTAIHDLSSAMQAFATNTEKRLSRIESTMVTKDYLDERLSHILAMPPSLESL